MGKARGSEDARPQGGVGTALQPAEPKSLHFSPENSLNSGRKCQKSRNRLISPQNLRDSGLDGEGSQHGDAWPGAAPPSLSAPPPSPGDPPTHLLIPTGLNAARGGAAVRGPPSCRCPRTMRGGPRAAGAVGPALGLCWGRGLGLWGRPPRRPRTAPRAPLWGGAERSGGAERPLGRSGGGGGRGGVERGGGRRWMQRRDRARVGLGRHKAGREGRVGGGWPGSSEPVHPDLPHPSAHGPRHPASQQPWTPTSCIPSPWCPCTQTSQCPCTPTTSCAPAAVYPNFLRPASMCSNHLHPSILTSMNANLLYPIIPESVHPDFLHPMAHELWHPASRCTPTSCTSAPQHPYTPTLYIPAPMSSSMPSPDTLPPSTPAPVHPDPLAPRIPSPYI